MSKELTLSTEGLRPDEIQRGEALLGELRMRKEIREQFRKMKPRYGVYGAAERISDKYPVSESKARKIWYGRY